MLITFFKFDIKCTGDSECIENHAETVFMSPERSFSVLKFYHCVYYNIPGVPLMFFKCADAHGSMRLCFVSTHGDYGGRRMPVFETARENDRG